MSRYTFIFFSFLHWI